MVGQINNDNQANQAKLDSSLDYDVFIVGAGQVSCSTPRVDLHD
jgi:hypothetical protein